MATASTILGRPSERKDLIARRLRDQIVEGQLTPGSQLPTRSEIEREFQASPGTVQSALEHLRRDGFVVVNGRQGTFVAENPPHLTNYALVFPGLPSGRDTNWVRFWTALANEGVALQNTNERNISVYYNINEHQTGDDFHRLVKEVRAHRLAGMIFASDPFLVEDTPIVEESGIPRVVVGTVPAESGLPTVGLDGDSYWNKAIEYLQSRGRNRIGVIMPPQPSEYQLAVADRIRQAGSHVETHWVQGVHLKAPELARNLAHLLFHPSHSERPDGLVIADDNLVEHVTGGLVAAGVRVPEDVEVVAHCNFPWPTPSVLPVKRLGYDARSVLEAAFQMIDAQRRGQQFSPSRIISAVYEEEI